MATTRNRTGILDADLRADVDPIFEALHDALERAYYDHWRHGRSQPWQGYDVQATPEASKLLFDRLHGAIFHHHEIALADADEARPAGRRRPAHRTQGPDGRPKRDVSTAWLADVRRHGITIQVPERRRTRDDER